MKYLRINQGDERLIQWKFQNIAERYEDVNKWKPIPCLWTGGQYR